MKIAFHAPMKPADHPAPSGDRRMAQLLIVALELAGHEVEVASRLRTYLPAPDLAAQARIRGEAEQEAERIAGTWADTAARPDLWFTYHNYHKAPDLLGPVLAERFALPYLLAETSRAPKRADDWADWYDAAEAALAAADVHLCFTDRDRAGILSAVKAGARLFDLPPFIDTRAFPPARDRTTTEVTALVTVAMMRPGDKFESFVLLAEALTKIQDCPWHLTIVGDGPARQQVDALFASMPPSRIRWTGALASDAVLIELDRADIFVWPGLGEAFGLSYLEAQAMGLPVAALDTAGVFSVVRHGITGLLTREASPVAFGGALRRLCLDKDERLRLSRSAATWVRGERTLEGATQILSQALVAAAAARMAHV